MIRKLVLPVLAAALLAGCVTPYAYRGGVQGDYYYGQPSTDYRYYGPYGGYAPYGYGGYGYGAYGYPGYYGYPYYGYGHRGFYTYPYYRPHQHRRPPTYWRPDGNSGTPQHRQDDRRPAWRNLDPRRRQATDGGGVVQPREVVPQRPAAERRDEGGSRMEQVIRRANRSGDPAPAEQEP